MLLTVKTLRLQVLQDGRNALRVDQKRAENRLFGLQIIGQDLRKVAEIGGQLGFLFDGGALLPFGAADYSQTVS